MDNKDQRNASVPLGTFNEEGAADANENTDLFVQVADQDSSSEPSSSADFARARPGRKRVRTLLGVPLADVGEPARDGSSQRSESISEAIQHLLDDQASIELERRERLEHDDGRESDAGAVLSEADLDELAEIPQSGVLNVGPTFDESANDDAPTKTRIPLLVPSQYVEAQALDRAQSQSAQSADSEIELEPIDEPIEPIYEDDERPTRERMRIDDDEASTSRVAGAIAAATAGGSMAADGGGGPVTKTKTLIAADGGSAPATSVTTEAAETASAHATTAPAVAPAARSAAAAVASAAPASGRPGQPPVSSLAPREVARKQPAARDAGPGVGLLMVAAMALIAAGGWWYTSGSFNRSRDSQANERGAATQAAASQPIAPSSESAMALDTPPSQAPSANDALGMQGEAAAAEQGQGQGRQGQDEGAVGPNPMKSSSLTATSRSLRPRTSKAPKLVPTKTTGGLAEAPTRADVLQKMESVRPAVRACATGLSGVADLDVTIAHSGRVTHVLVGGDFAGTTQGSCIARAVREAKFPSFKQERFRLLFPYPI